MIGNEITLVAALVAGLAGSGHCVAMCGGMASLLAARQHQGKPVRQALTYNLGRITSYAFAGLVVGFLGQVLVLGSGLQVLAGQMRLVTGLLIAIAGLTLIFGNRLFMPFEKIGTIFWKKLSPLAVKRLAGELNPVGIFTLGLLWGWLPCGMTYAMLATAAVTADPVHAAGLMLAFGLGTLPAMVGTGLAGMKLRGLLANGNMKRIAGVAMIIIGIWTAQPMKLLAEFQEAPPAAERHHRQH